MFGWRRSPRKSVPQNAVEEEIGFHIAVLTEDYIAQGLPPEEARRRALLEFGGREQVRQQVREVHVFALAEKLLFNLRAAGRFLRKSPSFSIVVILTLALGIGANSAVFSAIDAVIFRPLPYPDGEQLMMLDQHNSKGRDANRFVAPVRLEDWNRMNSTFRSISGYYFDDLTETAGAMPEKVTECLVAPRFLDVMGVAPALGREFAPGEEHWGGSSAVLLSYKYWQRRFHGDPAALGQKMHVSGYTSTIIGVMPASFQFPNDDVDMWTPSAPDAPFAKGRDSTWFTVVGRLKPGVSVNLAAADMDAVQSRLGKQFGKPDDALSVAVTPLKATIIGEVRDSLWLLYGSVTLLLLIACSNIAALLLARTAEREHEISIRFSLGASRRAIVVQILTEVLALALLGSLAGLVIAAAATHEFHRLADTLPRAEEITLNWRIVVYTLAAALATTLLCGLIPAFRGTRRQLAQALAAGGRTTQVSTRRPLQWFLVGVQVMLAVTLLIGAGLLLRSFQKLGRVKPGFDPDRVLTFQVSGSWGETTAMANVIQRINRTLDNLRRLPGVEGASTAAMLPGVPAHYQLEFKIDGKAGPDPLLADTRYVSADYFHTMGIPVLLGDPCAAASTNPEVVINRSFAERYFAGESPIGHGLAGASTNGFLGASTIRGVVGNAREEGINEAPVPTAYFCTPAPTPFPNYLVQTKGDPMAMAESIRRRIHEIEPSRSVYAFAPLQEHLDDASSENRLRTILLTSFAGTAILLASIGLYGTLSYRGRLRQREVGIRLALGAMRNRIIAQFVLEGLRVAAIGCVAGLALGLGLTHFIGSMLYGVSALDPVTYASVIGLMLVVAACASLVPSLRASRVEPVQVLRQD